MSALPFGRRAAAPIDGILTPWFEDAPDFFWLASAPEYFYVDRIHGVVGRRLNEGNPDGSYYRVASAAVSYGGRVAPAFCANPQRAASLAFGTNCGITNRLIGVCLVSPQESVGRAGGGPFVKIGEFADGFAVGCGTDVAVSGMDSVGTPATINALAENVAWVPHFGTGGGPADSFIDGLNCAVFTVTSDGIASADVFPTTAYAARGTTAIVSPSAAVYINSYREATNYRSSNYRVHAVAIWNRSYNASQYQSWRDKMYSYVRGLFGMGLAQVQSLFTPPRQIYIVPTAGGAPYTMPADMAAYALTGTTTAFDLSVAAATSSYALTGNAAAFDLRMAASATSYTLTATATAFDLSMAAGVGSYALTGTATAFDLAMAASVASYALTGIDATLTYTPTSVLTYAPTRDVSSGNWTGGYTTIDEGSASDADYAQSGTNPTADAYRFAFDGVPSGVRPTTGHVVRYRIKQDGSCNATIKLYSGSTLVSTWTHTPAPSDWTTYEQTLDATAAGNISTSSADLNLEIVAG